MRPLILDFAIRRADDNSNFDFHYSPQQSLSVITTGNTETPVIDLESNNYNQQSQTRVAREQSDHVPQLATETKVAREGTDKEFIMLELQTKTFTARESDDERPNHH